MASFHFFSNNLSNATALEVEPRNFLEKLSHTEILKEFRMTKIEIMQLTDLLNDDLKSNGRRKVDLSVEDKILIALKTLSSGSFQHSAKDLFRVSQSTVSKVLGVFLDALISHSSDFIHMPRNRQEIDRVNADFYCVAGFPGVLGCIDCTHIPIIAPADDEYSYVNRKNFHSINVQAICDANLVFQDIVARWPGSASDSFILNSSGRIFSQNFSRVLCSTFYHVFFPFLIYDKNQMLLK